MSHPRDLSHVPPERRAETRRRIDAIEAFLRVPGRAEAERHAADLGIGAAQFYNLVRAWRDLGRPELIARPGGGRRAAALGPGQQSLIEDVIGANPRMATPELVRTIMRSAAGKGIVMPRQEIVTRDVSRARPTLLPVDVLELSDLAFDHTVLEMSVNFGMGRAVRPLATVIIDVGVERIIGVALSPGRPSAAAAAAATLDALRHGVRSVRGTMTGPLRIRHSAGPGMDWDGLDTALTRAGLQVERFRQDRRGTGRLIESLLGRRTSWLKLLPRLAWSDGEWRTSSQTDACATSSPGEALRAVRPLMVGTGGIDAFARMESTSRARLSDGLAAIVREHE